MEGVAAIEKMMKPIRSVDHLTGKIYVHEESQYLRVL
jgi:hypothetical protein